MSEPMLCCRGGGYCARCDLLVGLDGLRVVEVARDAGGALSVTVESEPEGMGCRACGVVAHAHGRWLWIWSTRRRLVGGYGSGG
jgi:hypothetical protein